MFPTPSDPSSPFLPLLAAVLGSLPCGCCTSHSWSEDNSRRSGTLEPAPVTSASKLMGVCPDGLNGGLNPKAKCLTKDSFLQTGSFDTFTESADLLMCSRGHISPTPHYRSVLKLLYISFLFCTLGVRVLKSYRYVRHRGPFFINASCITSSLSDPSCVILSSCGFPVTVCAPVSLT